MGYSFLKREKWMKWDWDERQNPNSPKYAKHKKGEGFFFPDTIIVLRAQESRCEFVTEHSGEAAAAGGGDTCMGTVQSALLHGSSDHTWGQLAWISAQNEHGSSTDLITELQGINEQCRTRFQMPQKSCCWVTQPCTALSLYHTNLAPTRSQPEVDQRQQPKQILVSTLIYSAHFIFQKSCLALKSSPSFPLEESRAGFEEANISPTVFSTI